MLGLGEPSGPSSCGAPGPSPGISWASGTYMEADGCVTRNGPFSTRNRPGAASEHAARAPAPVDRAPAAGAGTNNSIAAYPAADPPPDRRHKGMSTVRLEAVKMDTVKDIPLQPASLDIWDKKYRLKTKAGEAVDEDIDATYR